jgi:RNA polymerase sigma factor (TIGR02999 family)
VKKLASNVSRIVEEIPGQLKQQALSADTVARLMRDLRHGDVTAKQELVRFLYPELRRVAAFKMKRERANHTLQPTALVNELYLELLKIRQLPDREFEDSQEKAAFMNLAGKVMDRLLIHHARRLATRVERIDLDDTDDPSDCGAEALQRVENALVKLEAISPRLRAVVEMRIFEGLTGDEIAKLLGCSPRTVATTWTFAREWLQANWADRRPA